MTFNEGMQIDTSTASASGGGGGLIALGGGIGGLLILLVAMFLGVDPGAVSEVPRENVTAHPHETRRHVAMSRLARAGSAITARLPRQAGSVLTDRLERSLQQGAAPRRPLTWEQRAQLIGEFEEDVAVLSSITGHDFSDWVRPRENSGGLVGARPQGQSQARNGRPREY